MQLQDLKWWAWAIIGLGVGLALSYAYTNWDRSLQYMAGNDFEFQRDLLRVERRAEGDPPRITGVRLHPTVDPDTTRVTFGQIDLETRAYVPRELISRKPFRVEVANGTDYGRRNPAPDVRTYLDAVKAANPDTGLNYSYAFWEEKPWTYAIFTTASVLIIGGAWPLLLRLLVGAGFGRAPREKDEYDLDRFGKGKPEPVAAAAHDPDAERAELDAVTAAYEARIGKGVDEDDEIESAMAEASATQGAPEVPKLIAGSSAEETTARPVEEEDKEYKGEFYPVARPVVHKDGDTAGH